MYHHLHGYEKDTLYVEIQNEIWQAMTNHAEVYVDEAYSYLMQPQRIGRHLHQKNHGRPEEITGHDKITREKVQGRRTCSRSISSQQIRDGRALPSTPPAEGREGLHGWIRQRRVAALPSGSATGSRRALAARHPLRRHQLFQIWAARRRWGRG